MAGRGQGRGERRTRELGWSHEDRARVQDWVNKMPTADELADSSPEESSQGTSSEDCTPLGYSAGHHYPSAFERFLTTFFSANGGQVGVRSLEQEGSPQQNGMQPPQQPPPQPVYGTIQAPFCSNFQGQFTTAPSLGNMMLRRRPAQNGMQHQQQPQQQDNFCEAIPSPSFVVIRGPEQQGRARERGQNRPRGNGLQHTPQQQQNGAQQMQQPQQQGNGESYAPFLSHDLGQFTGVRSEEHRMLGANSPQNRTQHLQQPQQQNNSSCVDPHTQYNGHARGQRGRGHSEGYQMPRGNRLHNGTQQEHQRQQEDNGEAWYHSHGRGQYGSGHSRGHRMLRGNAQRNRTQHGQQQDNRETRASYNGQGHGQNGRGRARERTTHGGHPVYTEWDPSKADNGESYASYNGHGQGQYDRGRSRGQWRPRGNRQRGRQQHHYSSREETFQESSFSAESREHHGTARSGEHWRPRGNRQQQWPSGQTSREFSPRRENWRPEHHRGHPSRRRQYQPDPSQETGDRGPSGDQSPHSNQRPYSPSDAPAGYGYGYGQPPSPQDQDQGATPQETVPGQPLSPGLGAAVPSGRLQFSLSGASSHPPSFSAPSPPSHSSCQTPEVSLPFFFVNSHQEMNFSRQSCDVTFLSPGFLFKHHETGLGG